MEVAVPDGLITGMRVRCMARRAETAAESIHGGEQVSIGKILS